MLNMNIVDKNTKSKQTVFNIDNFNEVTKRILVADHCYGCTAGAGSSCGGETTNKTNLKESDNSC